MLNLKDLRAMDDTTILTEIENLKKELFDLRFKHATGQLENTARLYNVRKTIARMKTILTEREGK
ncbi:MAG: 50S ribosomal protein L29 [Acholeplasmataceae bacterium]|jgi:large subunit ribosomal protein L29|nr:50S ribosomal protein L29 [Candidatus Izemoplasmatales bacterium]